MYRQLKISTRADDFTQLGALCDDLSVLGFGDDVWLFDRGIPSGGYRAFAWIAYDDRNVNVADLWNALKKALGIPLGFEGVFIHAPDGCTSEWYEAFATVTSNLLALEAAGRATDKQRESVALMQQWGIDQGSAAVGQFAGEISDLLGIDLGGRGE